MAFRGNAETHSKGRKSLTFTEKPDTKHKTQKRPKPKIVKTYHYDCAYATVMAILIIIPIILQTVINLRMLSIGQQEAKHIV